MDMSTATPYPRLVGFLESTNNVTVSVSIGWTPVRYTSATNNMEITVNVNDPTEVYLVTYAYSVTTSSSVNHWTGIRIIGPTSKFISGDGTHAGTNSFSASGSFFVTGLSPGTYTIRLEYWTGYSGNRTFTADIRQLLVYRIR
jgi:hypothetical protein